MVIALEGLPGAGKTTSAYLLAGQLGASVVCETTLDHPFLETIYDDAARYDLQVELGFLLLHNAAYRQIQRQATVVTDFSPVKDLLFAEAMLSGEDLLVFTGLYKHLYADHPSPELVVYLDASPELCMKRVRQRMESNPARRFEAGLDVERLRLIGSVYESRIAELAGTVLRFDIHDGQTETEIADGVAELLRNQIPNGVLPGV
jgi:deoxyadenosine/deoxycytidine kinase